MPEGYSSFELIDVLAEKRARVYLNHYLSQKHPLGRSSCLNRSPIVGKERSEARY